MLGCDDEVALLGQQEPASEGDAIHCGNGRLGDLDVAPELRREVGWPDRERRLRHLLQVPACTERLVAGPGQHQDLSGVVAVEAVDRVEQPLPDRSVESIAGFGPVDCQPGHPVDDLVADHFLAHEPRP